MGKESEKCYCAFCKEPRRVYTKRHMTVSNVFLSLVTSGLVMLILWQQPDPRVFLVFVVCLAISEIFIQIRWRVSIACPHCGFNPVVYMKDPEKAAARVSEYFEIKKQDPAFFLSRNPLVKVAQQQAQAKRLAARQEALALKGKNASGQLISKTL